MLVGTYREIIWHARNDAHHNDKHTTPEQLKAKFLGKIAHACKRYFSREDMKRINKLNESQYERLRESDSESVRSTTSLTSMIVMFNKSSSIGWGSIGPFQCCLYVFQGVQWGKPLTYKLFRGPFYQFYVQKHMFYM